MVPALSFHHHVIDMCGSPVGRILVYHPRTTVASTQVIRVTVSSVTERFA